MIERLIKGTRTALTYKVKLSFNVWWEAAVYEPYATRSWFGLGPTVIKYRRVFVPAWKTFIHYKEHATPGEVIGMATRAVHLYEDHKLAWEAA